GRVPDYAAALDHGVGLRNQRYVVEREGRHGRGSGDVRSQVRGAKRSLRVSGAPFLSSRTSAASVGICFHFTVAGFGAGRVDPDASRGMTMSLMKKFLALFFLIQLAVPAYQLTQPRVQRFGWQMYSGLAPSLEMMLVLEDGTQASFSAGELLAERRSEMNERERRIIVRAA